MAFEPTAQNMGDQGQNETVSLVQNMDREDEFWDGMKILPPVAEVVDSDWFNIEGSDFSQILQIRVRPGEIITTEPGSMVVMSDGLVPNVDMGDCGQACTRCCCAGESFFRLVFTNMTSETKFLGISPPGPGRIIPIDLNRYSGITFNTGAFVAAVGKNWQIRLRVVDNLATGACGGQGFILNELHGDGMAFLTGIGAIERLVLQPGEKYIVDKECVLAFEKSVKFDVRSYGCSMVCCCGGFGLFQSVLTGPGLVLIQTLPMSKLRRAIGAGGGDGGGGGGGGGGG